MILKKGGKIRASPFQPLRQTFPANYICICFVSKNINTINFTTRQVIIWSLGHAKLIPRSSDSPHVFWCRQEKNTFYFSPRQLRNRPRPIQNLELKNSVTCTFDRKVPKYRKETLNIDQKLSRGIQIQNGQAFCYFRRVSETIKETN